VDEVREERGVVVDERGIAQESRGAPVATGGEDGEGVRGDVPVDDPRFVGVCDALHLAMIVWIAAVVHADHRGFVPIELRPLSAIAAVDLP
jgi:hypothetical protein